MMRRAALFLLPAALAACTTATQSPKAESRATVKLIMTEPQRDDQEGDLVKMEVRVSNESSVPILLVDLEMASNLVDFPRSVRFQQRQDVIRANGWKVTPEAVELEREWNPGIKPRGPAAVGTLPPYLSGSKESEFAHVRVVVPPGGAHVTPVVFQLVSLEWKYPKKNAHVACRVRYVSLSYEAEGKNVWFSSPANPDESVQPLDPVTKEPQTKVTYRYEHRDERPDYARAIVHASALNRPALVEASEDMIVFPPREVVELWSAGGTVAGVSDALFFAPEKSWVLKRKGELEVRPPKGASARLSSDIFDELRSLAYGKKSSVEIRYYVGDKDLDSLLEGIERHGVKGGWAATVPAAKYLEVIRRLEAAGYRVTSSSSIAKK